LFNGLFASDSSNFFVILLAKPIACLQKLHVCVYAHNIIERFLLLKAILLFISKFLAGKAFLWIILLVLIDS